MLSGHIEPFWDNSYYLLPYIDEFIKQPDIQKMWLDAGHPTENLIIETYSQPKPMPLWINSLVHRWPDYRNFGFSFHKFSPGRYLPDHRDSYDAYRKKFDVDLTEVIRILLYLEDWKPGQFNTIDNRIMHNWKAGDWIAWHGDTVHSVANFGLHARYALAITCHL